MLQNLYHEGSNGQVKTQDKESTFKKGNAAIVIPVAYAFILYGTQDSLVGKQNDFDNDVIKTTHFSKAETVEEQT